MEKLLPYLPPRPQPFFIRYGISALIMLGCCLIQGGIYRYTGFTGFFLLLPGIFASGVTFDRGSGFFATLIGLAFAAYLSPPIGQNPSHLIPLSVFALCGVLTAFVSESLRKTMERLQASERSKDLLLRELAHRTKNNMAIMAALLRLQKKSAAGRQNRQSLEEALEAAARRINVMAQLHEHLTPRGEGRMVRMSSYLDELIDNMQHIKLSQSVKLDVRSDDIELPESHALPIAIAINELITNSFKHAFPDGRAGEIKIELRAKDEVILRVQDDGVGCTEEQLGLGSKLTQMMVQQLDGRIIRRKGTPGCEVEIRIPRPPELETSNRAPPFDHWRA